MTIWHCYLGVRDSECLKSHQARASWTETNRERSPYPQGHELCGFVEIPERGEKSQFELVY